MRKTEAKTFITKYYLYKLFSVMGFIIPFIAIMFDANGLSATEIAICMMSAKIVQLATEIPSGAIADKYSRKYVLLVSRLLNGIPWIIWILYPTFWGYLTGYIFFGLSMSFDSGCAEAFVYDELSKYKKRELFERVLGRGGALTSVGIFIASITASFLVKLGFDYNSLMVMSLATTVISAFAMFTIKPAKKQKDIEEVEDILTYVEILKKGIKYAFGHKFVLKFILFLAFTNFINTGILEYSEIFYNEITRNLAKVAIIFGIMEIAFAIGNFCGEYLKIFSIKTLIFFYFFASLLDIVAFSIYKYPISIMLCIFDTLLICSVFINFSGRRNDLIPSKIRATVLSVGGFVESVGTFICLFLFGVIVDHFGNYRSGFLIFSYLYAAGTFIFLVIFLRDEKAIDKK
jgi:MFS family permease